MAVPTQSVGGEDHPASDFAYVPDPDKPSTWKLPVYDSTHVSAAVAALGQGFRGKKVQIPAGDMKAVKAKVKAAYKKFYPEKDVPPILKAANINVDLDDMPISLASQLLSLFAQYTPWGTTFNEVVGDTDDMNDPDLSGSMDGSIPIMKALDSELRQGTYVVLAPDKTDLHGDIYSATEVAKACHNFNEYCGTTFIDHKEDTDQAKIVESYLAPVDMKVGDQLVTKGTWLAVVQYDESLWQEVKKGKYTGLSIGAYAKTEKL